MQMADRNIHPIERSAWAEPLGRQLFHHIAAIDQYLDRFDDPGVRLYALQELEERYRTIPERLRSDWDHWRLRALALWRLHRQQL
jgi:hypothetical protein